ncbi:MAG: DUF6291 domain-containing protein [Oscillospiraceae bacterium]
MRTQFTFYESFYKAISRIKKKADRADAYDIICAYALFQEEPNLDSVSDAVAIAFELLRPVLDKAREKAESGKSGGSKSKANGKQNGSKQEANCKQEEDESEKEKEKEKEGEIENECYPPTPFSKIIASYSFSEPLMAKTTAWLKYKSERRESYKEQGLKSLLTQIQKNAAKYGEQAVIDLMEQCMAANWAGIIWDRLMKGGTANGKPDGNAQSERVGHYL